MSTGSTGSMEHRIDTGTPVADHVLKLLDAAKTSNAVIQACDLKLFDEIQKSTVAPTSDELAKRKGWEADILRRLMDTMVAVKLLSKSKNDKGEDIYANTEEGRLLVKDGPTGMYEYAMMVNDDCTSIQRIAGTIRKDPPTEAPAAATDTKEEISEEGYGGSYPPEFWINIYRMCDGIARPYANQIVTAVDLSQHKTAVDLGGGSGVFSYALLKAYPEMKVVLAELPASMPVIEEHFISKNKHPRLSTLAVDYNTDVLPQADLYFIANVMHDHEPDKCKELLSKIHAVINAGGAIVIIDQLLNDRRDGPPLAHAWDLAFSGMGMMHSGKELVAILNDCHFGDVQIVKTQDCCTSDVVYGMKKEK